MTADDEVKISVWEDNNGNLNGYATLGDKELIECRHSSKRTLKMWFSQVIELAEEKNWGEDVD